MLQQEDRSAYIDTHWKKIYRLDRPPNRDYFDDKGGLDEDDDHLIYKFKLKMANTLSVMTNVLRNVVSKKRIRYKENGFDLDLAYISDNIIAMGYPADNLESIYRNRLEDVYKFLEEHHQDHYRIYNLCLERSYDKNKFHGRVALYPFEDHNPPTIELIQKFCNDVDTWLRADSRNVAAVHCKAGKGRTGTMICCYLLYSGQHGTPEEALAYYDSKRTKDRKGVTIPSQRRYVQYFSQLLQSQQIYEKCTLQFCEIRFMEAHILHNHGTVCCTISVLQDTHAVKVEVLRNFCMDFRKCLALDLRNSGLDVSGDIKIELNSKSARKKIFHFWFNTFFISNSAEIEGEGDDEKYVYTLNKWEIDDVHKDKEHKCYPENFKVQLVFYKNAGNKKSNQTTNTVSGNRTGRSSNYEFSQVGNTEMGGRHFMTHNSYPLTTGVACAVSPMTVSTQLNNSGSNLSFNCDQMSSSSSASVSSLAGGSVNDSTKTKFISENKLKMISNGNVDLKLNALSLPPSNPHCNVSSFLSEGIGADSLVQSSLSGYNNFSTVNNVTLKQKVLRQNLANPQQDQQQYQPSGNNIVVPPSKVSRGNKIEFEEYMSDKIGSNNVNSINNSLKNNGILNTNGVGENDHELDYDVEPEVIEDEDAEEDWESGESSAISIQNFKTPLNTDIDTTITATFLETTLLPSPAPLVPSTTRTAPYLKTTLINSKFSVTSNIHALTGFSSMNLESLTNTSTSSSCSLYSKPQISGENDGNDCIRNVVNEIDGCGDDDNQNDHSELDPKLNGKGLLNRNSNSEGYNTTAVGAENINADSMHPFVPTSRNKFFSFTKTRTPSRAPDNSNVIHVSPTKPPFFRRKSFKSANSIASGDIALSNSNNDPTTTIGCSGLAPSSKQKLKIKLKKNRFKLAQKFEKLQSYLRADPDDFCESLAKQTIVKRNSNSSLSNKNQKAIATSTKSTLSQSHTLKLSTSPGCNFKNSSMSQNSLKNCITPSSLEQLATQSSSSFSASVSASNASLGSNADCDLGCDCNDYYSSICDNQLSFENSPCKSPRSLADIALMSGSLHMGSTSSFNTTNYLSSSLQHRTSLCQHNNQNQHNNFQNIPRLPFLVHNKNGGTNPHLLKDQEQHRHEPCKDVIVVAARPAKTHAIGFNVIAMRKEIESKDGLDAPIQNYGTDLYTNTANQGLSQTTVNDFTKGTYNAKYRENIEKGDENFSPVYGTPPAFGCMRKEFFGFSSNSEASKSSSDTPFIFPTIINELTNIERTSEITGSKSLPPRTFNLLILKNNEPHTAVDGNGLVTNKTSSPDDASFESIENIGNSSATSTSNGNNTAETGTSSSGFSTSECCTNSSNSNGICDCNPLVLDLERYAATLANTTTCVRMNSNLALENKFEQEERSKHNALDETIKVERKLPDV